MLRAFDHFGCREHGIMFINKNQINSATAQDRTEQACKNDERQVIQRQAKTTTIATRNKRHANHFGAKIILPSLAVPAITREKPPDRVVWEPCQYSDFVPLLAQTQRQVVDAKILRPEILRDNQYFHACDSDLITSAIKSNVDWAHWRQE